MPTQDQILQAFLRRTAADKSHVAFAIRNPGEKQYLRVYGPSADPEKRGSSHVTVEFNGEVNMSKELGEEVPSDPRTSPSKSGGPKAYIRAAKVTMRLGSMEADDIVTAIIDGFKAAKLTW